MSTSSATSFPRTWLRLLGVEEVSASTRLAVRWLTGGVLSVEATIEPWVNAACCHWLGETHRKPPLDVSIAWQNGLVAGVQLVLQDEIPVRQMALPTPRKVTMGVPRCDIGAWEWPDRRYIDSQVHETVGWLTDADLAVTLVELGSRATVAFKVGNALTLLSDPHGWLIGAVFHGLGPGWQDLIEKGMIEAREEVEHLRAHWPNKGSGRPPSSDPRAR